MSISTSVSIYIYMYTCTSFRLELCRGGELYEYIAAAAGHLAEAAS